MQGSEFYEYINLFPEFKKHFKGVFSIDTLPKSLGYRKFLICNTDFQSGDGKHWLCFFQTEKNAIEVFIPSESIIIKNIYSLSIVNLNHNCISIQLHFKTIIVHHVGCLFFIFLSKDC